MWKKLGFLSFTAMLVSTALANANSDTRHMKSLRSKFPFGLIGDDFGILNENDLAINTCDAFPEPFSPESDVYPYWQCFETSSASMECEDEGYDTEERSKMAVLSIDIRGQRENHAYISRRAVHMKTCELYKKDWKRLTKGEKYFCASGEHWGTEKTDSDKPESLWSFDKFKTQKGCIPYFEGACSLRYQLKHGCRITSGDTTSATNPRSSVSSMTMPRDSNHR